MNIRPEWGKFWGGLVLELQRRAEHGNLDDRLLRRDAELGVSSLIGDWRHVARSSAYMALDVLNTGNPDITGYLMEIWEALQKDSQVLEPALLSMLIDESLRQTRVQMALEQNRSKYFRDQYQTYDRLLHFLEEKMGDKNLPAPLAEYLSGVYWDISENMKGRFFFDAEITQEKRAEKYASANRKTFVEAAGAVLKLYAEESKAMPSVVQIAGAVSAAIERHSAQLKTALATLAPRHPDRLEQFSLADLRAALPADTAVLTVAARPMLQDDKGGLMLVTAKGAHFAPLAVFRYEYDVISPLLKSWGSNPVAEEGHDGLAFLYRALIQPFETEMQHIEHLIIVPSGPFNNVPYAALWDEKNQRYLIERYHVSIMPFGKSLATYFTSPSRRPRHLLYAANPGGWSAAGWDQSIKEKKTELTPDRVSGFASLPDLPDLGEFAAKEQAAIQDAWPTGFEALVSGHETGSPRPPWLDRALLLRRMPKVNIVHLSMHGLDGPPDNPERSLLLLNSDARKPELLFPTDLKELNLKGLDLVVLSACSIGRSYNYRPAELAADGDRWLYRMGEFSGFPAILYRQGVGGLIGAVAEVPAAIDASLWSVFYRRLHEGQDPSRALATTQRAMLSDPKSRHPRHWGLYLLFGGWRSAK